MNTKCRKLRREPVRYREIATYRLIRRLRPIVPAWAAFVVVRSMRRTPGSSKWCSRTTVMLAESIAANWPMAAAMAHPTWFLCGSPRALAKKWKSDEWSRPRERAAT